MTRPEQRLQAAAAWAYAVGGFALSSWFVRTPDLRAARHLSTGDLGLTSFAVAATGLIAMQAAGPLTARFGSGRVVRLGILALPLLLLPPALAPDVPSLLVGLIGFGVAVGTLDVAMNTHAAAVEWTLGRPVMNRMHAAWSVGNLAGTLCAGWAAAVGWSQARHYAVAAVLLGVGSLIATRHLLPSTADRPAGDAPVRSAWTRQLLRFGVLAACCLLVEAALSNWAVVFLTDERGLTSSVAAYVFLAFGVAMAAGRSVGDELSVRFGSRRLVQAGGVVAAAALAAVLAIPSWKVALPALAVCGAGLSVLGPTILGAVGRAAESTSIQVGGAMARVCTVGYAGVLSGPVLIGFLAEGTGLRAALFVLVGLIILVSTQAPFIAAVPARPVVNVHKRRQAHSG